MLSCFKMSQHGEVEMSIGVNVFFMLMSDVCVWNVVKQKYPIDVYASCPNLVQR